jgi:precorrin-8X/cobalt-precorrin-8 methylmutase
LLGKWGGRVICYLQKTGDRGQGTEKIRETKSERGIEIGLRENKNIGIIAIGNAPTALFKVLKLLAAFSLPRTPYTLPLIIGVPVGFVRAVESKDELARTQYPFITALGRKGGSTVAAAIVNALLKLADEKN